MANLKPQQFQWLKDHIGDYIFSPSSTQLEKNIKETECDDPRIDELYNEFVGKFCNDPYKYLAGNEKRGGDIYAGDYKYYFLENKYGINLPVGYYKDLRQPLPYPLLPGTQADRYADENLREINRELDPLRKNAPYLFDKTKLSTRLFLQLVIGIVSAAAMFFSFKGSLSYGFTKSVPGTVCLCMLVFCIICFLFAIGGISYYSRILKDFDKTDALNNYRTALFKRINKLESAIKLFEESESDGIKIEQFIPDISTIKEIKKSIFSGCSVFMLIPLLIMGIGARNLSASNRMAVIKENPATMFRAALGQSYGVDLHIKSVIKDAGTAYNTSEEIKPDLADVSVYNANIGDLFDEFEITVWESGAYTQRLTFIIDGTPDTICIDYGNVKYDGAKIKKAIVHYGENEYEINFSKNSAVELAKLSAPVEQTDRITVDITELYNDGNYDMLYIPTIHLGNSED
ncbi:MAG TPA: hypothetical protein DCG28_03370 [Lachnospiraceae bacterium]|nr:hypothetical protein [Lachnospiraceae bacterium]